MKIEIGESLIRSWLRHVRKCQIAELNWKPSETWVENQFDSQGFMTFARSRFEEISGENIFGSTKNVDQLIKQGEMDVLGIQINLKGHIERVIAVDIAYHGGGLNYKNSQETRVRVVKKLIRSYLIARSYFGEIPIELVFASPVVRKSFNEPLIEIISELNSFLSKHSANAEARYFANDSFYTEILRPTLEQAGKVADTSELFFRSFQLLEIFAHSMSDAYQGLNDDATLPDQPGNRTLPIEFEPTDESEFKNKLIEFGSATIETHYHDGSTTTKLWNASQFTESSNLKGNLRSRFEFRNDQWKRRGIKKIKVKIAA